MRARSSRATRHCSCGAVLTTSRIITVSSVELLDAPHLGRREHHLGPSCASSASATAVSAITSLRAVEVGVVRDGDVEDDARPLLRLVADAADRTVRDVPDDAFDVAQSRRAQASRLRRCPTRHRVSIDVADAVPGPR